MHALPQSSPADNWAGSNAIGAWNGYYTFVRDASASGNVARLDAERHHLMLIGVSGDHCVDVREELVAI